MSPVNIETIYVQKYIEEENEQRNQAIGIMMCLVNYLKLGRVPSAGPVNSTVGPVVRPVRSLLLKMGHNGP